MKIGLTCTSYLPARSPVWRHLNPAEIEIGGYGDWPVALTRSDARWIVVWVVFLEDLLPWSILRQGGEAVSQALDTALGALDRRLQSVDAPTIVAWLGGYEDSPIRRARKATLRDRAAAEFERELYERCARYPRLYLLSLDRLFAAQGLRGCLDARNYQVSRCRLSLVGLNLLAEGLEALIKRMSKPACKALVLDCDNTLWGGVIGEVGLSGIVLGQDGLGQAFVAFQQALALLSDSGVILAISSKNEANDVWQVFDRHPAMALHRADIIAARIDWNEKTQHLQEIAAELGLGLDSLVFWDDNPIEREKIRASLPMVVVPEPPPEVADWPSAILSLNALARMTDTQDDLAKKAQYQARASFESALRSAPDGRVFLANIEMVPRCIELDEATLPRAVQLCAKTNQFNLRLARHDEAALKKLTGFVGCEAFLVALQDKFGDHGITGLVVAYRPGREDTAFLDTFLLSCRILGRHVEAWMLDRLRQRLLAAGYRYLVAEFIPSERNTPAARFLDKHGLNLWQGNGTTDEFVMPDEMKALFAPSSQRYWVDLQRWQIPYLDIFRHESSATA
ncbi:HAD-IIIC family phosphatase [Sulfuricystis multivorans]|uniref:HAD-IIIC family phosphatase n=1 Tax=Sulfuricystis multivorans TaxID=2211108 RepID=UPI001559CA4A|nr:HAD-IIIC family phosphatase [Sulfuricystis multivorans]